MKNIIALGLAVVMGLGTLVYAAPTRSFPKQKDGSAVAHPFYGGFSYFTETNATESVVCTGKCLLVGFYRSTGAAATNVELRDSAVIGSADLSLLMHPRSDFETNETSYTATNPMNFPVLAANGISVSLSSIGADEHVTVVYLDLND